MRAVFIGTVAVALLGATFAAVSAQSTTVASTEVRPGQTPFGPGERMVFDVRFGPVRVGTGTMEVREMTAVRGRRAYHTVFTLRGGTFFYKVDDVMQSWMDAQTLASLRFTQDLEQGSRERERRYEIYPERRVYVETSSDSPVEQPSVDLPLDDGSFLYFIRTIPLEVGEQYDFNRYFKPDRNPVRVRVMRKERVSVPAGSFDAIVLRPTIKSRGIFAEGGQAEVWISDDARRTVLQIRSRLSFGSISMHLRSYTAPGG
jgi:hypothetical protein